MAKSSGSQKARKELPPKPRPDFPLYPHLSGKWAKTIRGKSYYFGRWDDPHSAESEYLAVAEDLRASRVPRSGATAGPTIRDACNRFMSAKRIKMGAGNLSPRTFIDYDRSCQMLIEQLGRNRSVNDLRPSDFEKLYKALSEKHGLASLGGKITQVRSIFKYAYESDLIEKTVKFGPTFRSPSSSEIRKAKAKAKHQNGARTFQAQEIRQMLEAATGQLKAMLLLGINAGLGNTDCANLPISALDLTNGWLDYPRPKTGAERRIPLWPETVEALREVISDRKEPNHPDDAGIVFLTLFRQRWVRYDIEERKSYGKIQIIKKQDDAICKAITKLLTQLNLKRPGLSFYSLRHTFETVAGGSRDQVAVDALMGHIDSSMAANYRHGIEDERLRAVVNHVNDWLFVGQ